MTTDCIVSGLQLGIVWHRPWVLILTRHRDTISIASCYIRYYCECAKCTEESSKTFHLRKWRSHIHHLHEEYAPQAPDRLKVQTCGIIQKLYETRHIWNYVVMQFWGIYPKNRVLEVPKGKSLEIKKCCKCCYLTYVTSQKKLDPFLPVFSHFFMSYFDVFGSIFEKSAMTDLPKVIVSICLVSYNICMIPHVWGLTFGLNLSGAWGAQQHWARHHVDGISSTFVMLLRPVFSLVWEFEDIYLSISSNAAQYWADGHSKVLPYHHKPT